MAEHVCKKTACTVLLPTSLTSFQPSRPVHYKAMAPPCWRMTNSSHKHLDAGVAAADTCCWYHSCDFTMQPAAIVNIYKARC